MYLDSNGLIVQSNQDGGDTAARTGQYFTALSLRILLGLPTEGMLSNGEFLKACQLLITPKGLIRNPAPPYNNPKDTSRDQTRPMVIACGLWQRVQEIRQLQTKYNFYQNGHDVASPENWNEYRRALGQSPLWLGDAWLVGDVVNRLEQTENNMDDVGDDQNLILTLAQAFWVSKTKLSQYAFKTYLTKRSRNYGNLRMGEKDPVLGTIAWYNRGPGVFRPPGEAGGNSEMVEAWRPIIAKARDALNCPV